MPPGVAATVHPQLNPSHTPSNSCCDQDRCRKPGLKATDRLYVVWPFTPACSCCARALSKLYISNRHPLGLLHLPPGVVATAHNAFPPSAKPKSHPSNSCCDQDRCHKPGLKAARHFDIVWAINPACSCCAQPRVWHSCTATHTACYKTHATCCCCGYLLLLCLGERQQVGSTPCLLYCQRHELQPGLQLLCPGNRLAWL